jgi:hypothetical protein
MFFTDVSLTFGFNMRYAMVHASTYEHSFVIYLACGTEHGFFKICAISGPKMISSKCD